MRQTIPLTLLACLLLAALPAGATVYLLNGFTIIDNEPADANFAAAGLAGTDVGANNDGGFNFTRGWGNAGAATTATWNFGTGESGDPALALGTYEVFVSWRTVAQANLNRADYSGTDGFASISVDQEPGSLSYAGTLGVETFFTTGIYAPGNVTFVRLGTVLIEDGTFSLTVADDAIDPDYIFIDAAALRAIPEPARLAFGLALGAALFPLTRRTRARRP